MNRFSLKKLFPILVVLVLGYVAGVLMPLEFFAEARALQEEREHGETYTFINPLLSCGEGNFNHLGNDETRALEEKLSIVIEQQKARGSIMDAGVYFRELNGGPWVGVNFDAKFTPGSLLKVPLAMSVYQLSESDRGLLEREILFEGAGVAVEQHYDAPTIESGVYTVQTLVEAVLVNSDNTAAALLAQVTGKKELDYAYTRLGIATPSLGEDYEASVRDYASFFRILYNATYLNRANSERLLSLLSRSVYKDGIVAGVPEGTVVAHKFGERALAGEAGVQLHDCGIVYHSKQPYLLCIMMRGKDFETLSRAIAEISHEAYVSLH